MKQSGMNKKLTIELVPKTSHYNNVRSNVSKEKWDALRKACYRKANYKCEICGGKGSRHPVECHEVWEYDDDALRQTLVGLIALCPDCHSVKHAGLAQIQGKLNAVLNQLMEVNKMTFLEAKKYVYQSFRVWERRSQVNWKLDISFLEMNNV